MIKLDDLKKLGYEELTSELSFQTLLISIDKDKIESKLKKKLYDELKSYHPSESATGITIPYLYSDILKGYMYYAKFERKIGKDFKLTTVDENTICMKHIFHKGSKTMCALSKIEEQTIVAIVIPSKSLIDCRNLTIEDVKKFIDEKKEENQ